MKYAQVTDSDEGSLRQADPPTIAITRERKEGRFLVMVNQQPLWLTYNSFYLLLLLAAARDNVESGGFVRDELRTYPVAIHRLRQAFDSILGEQQGRRVIETGVSTEYRLEPSVVLKLGPDAAIPSQFVEADLFERLCRVCNAAQRNDAKPTSRAE